MAKKEDDSDDLGYLSFRVTPAFKREFKIYAVTHGITMIELLQRAFEALKKADKSAK